MGFIGNLIYSFGNELTAIGGIFTFAYLGGIGAGYYSTKRKKYDSAIVIIIFFVIGFGANTIKSLSVGRPGAILYLILSFVALIMLVMSKSEFNKNELLNKENDTK